MTDHNMTNRSLFACSWGSSILALVTLDLSTVWDLFITAAPWVSTMIYYLINFDTVNGRVKKIWKKISGK